MKNLTAIAIVLSFGLASAHAANLAPAKVEFNRDIRPILSDNCFLCHGPDKNRRKAKLRLDIRDEAVAKKAICPGKPEDSELVKHVFSDDPEKLMPPTDSNKKLTAVQKELLRRWISQGAEYQQHWSFEKPVRATVPGGVNAVDFLVAKRLEAVGLKPGEKADRRTLIRRLYFDLLGLPPTAEEVATFVNDQSGNAYSALLDRILANPHYGERMAIGWLDVVRFADTIGYHSDNPRNIWPYRDYVIKSFNDNKPFNQFTIEQVAGDLLPKATNESRVGSAFNRLLLSTEEGGAQAKDYEVRMLTDRVRSIGAAWMGQTTGCGQCHDHKFDPWTQRDFYSMGAFFADIKESVIGRREDGMVIVSPEQQKELTKLDADLEAAKKRFAVIAPRLDAAQRQWEADIVLYNVVLPELAKTSKASAAEKKAAGAVAAALKKADRSSKEAQAVTDYYRGKVTKMYEAERTAMASAENARAAFYGPLPKCIVSEHSDTKRVVRILKRGNWMDDSGEIVTAALPHYLPQPKIEGRELTRLDLANWLVWRDNPLTARVIMNRLWKQLFGTGLSKTLDDLGAQGELPPNQALLDTLAVEFMDSGWDIKHMIRLIVSSDAYQRVSTATSEQVAADPYNREISHQSAFRLDAELVRDNALAISGLLVPTIGGPSAKPYQPARYWENLNFPTREYEADTNQNQYRRGVYTWWQRTFLHPSLLAFDAPSREECCTERSRSNIPQQAIVLLNDPTYVEAARVLASHILADCKGDADQRIAWAWQRVLQRNPRAEEAKIVHELLNQQLAVYQKDAKAAESLLATGLTPAPATEDKSELAAWTHVARVLLNLHETITRS